MPGLITAGTVDDTNPIADVAGYDPSTTTIEPSKTVEGLTDSITRKDGLLMQSADTRGEQGAAKTGLLNTSISQGAREMAVLDKATQIASQDSAQHLQNEQFNASAENTSYGFNAASLNQARSQKESGNQAIDQIGAQGEQTRENITAQGDVESRLIAERGEIDKQLQTADGQIREDLLNRQGEIDRELQDAQFANNQVLQKSEQDFNIVLQQLRGDQAKELELIQANSAELRQTSQNAALYFSQVSASMAEIMANPDLDAASKEALISKQAQLLQNGLSVIGKIGNIDNLDSLLTFTGGYGSNNGGTYTGTQNYNNSVQVGTTQQLADGSSYTVPANFDWSAFLADPANGDLLAAYNRAIQNGESGISNHQSWGLRWAGDEATRNSDPRFKAAFGEQQQQTDVTTIDTQEEEKVIDAFEKSKTETLPDQEKIDSINALLEQGWTIDQMVQLSVDQDGGDPAIYREELKRLGF